jgi:pSer/pThr/pTyr-binding forkhead associated (FHA) protein
MNSVPCEEISAMPAFLVPVDPGQCLIPLEKAIVFIGRQADCDVSLTHSRKISRRHCCIAQVNHKFIVRDLGSTNGVFVNGARIDKEAFIDVGDELVIGDVQFKMQNEAPAARAKPPGKLVNATSKSNESGVTPPPIPVRRPQPVEETPDEPPIDLSHLDDDDYDPQRAPNTLDGIRRHRSKR